MSDLLEQRGAQPITLDKPRVIFYDHAAMQLLVDKFGVNIFGALVTAVPSKTRDGKPDVEVKLKSVENLTYALWAGLQAQARETGEDLSYDRVSREVYPLNLLDIFRRVSAAITRTSTVPPPKSQPAGPEAKAAAGTASQGPGPTKVTTSMKRSASRSAR